MEDPRYPVKLTIIVDDGRPICTGIQRIEESVLLSDGSLLEEGGPRITSTLLHRIPVERLVNEIVEMYAREEGRVRRLEIDPLEELPVIEDEKGMIRAKLPVYGREGGFEEFREALEAAGVNPKYERPRGRGHRLSDDQLKDVAKTYRLALKSGTAPVKAVQDAFGPISRSAAGRWVEEARRRGFLGPAPARGRLAS